VRAEAQVTVRLGPNRELQVGGTPGNDRILIAPFGPVILVVGRDGQGNVVRRAALKGRVRSLSVTVREGNDVVVNRTNLPSDISGGAGDDVLIGGSGSEEVKAGAGRDLVEAGADLGMIYGGDDADVLVGGDDVDYIEGNDGSDLIWGRAEYNLMLGGDGNDLIVGGPDQDEIMGQAGDDSLWGLGGTDGLAGDDGADLLCGGPQNDVLDGGPGNDSLYGEEDADDHDGGLGVNELYGDPQIGDTFKNGNQNADALCPWPGPGHGAGQGVLTLAKGAILMRSPGALVLAGTPGADTLRVEATADHILVSGNLAGSPLRRELPRDSSGERLYVDAQAGDDRITVVGAFDAVLLAGGDGNDEIDAQGAQASAAVLLGGAGSDVLRSGSGGAILAGEEGDDVLIPGAAQDLVSTGAGRDEVRAPKDFGNVLERWRPEDRAPLGRPLP